MGAYGDGPFDSDDASEMVNTKLLEPIHKLVFKRKFNHTDYGQLRAAAQVMILLYKQGFVLNDEITNKTIEHLQNIIKDDDYISIWHQPDAIKRSLKRQINQLSDYVIEYLE